MLSFTYEDIDDITSADEFRIFSCQMSEKFSILSRKICFESLQKDSKSF